MTVFENLDMKNLSSVEQEIYRYLMNNIETVPYMRVREIADEAHVSSTSVFRFIQKLGFESYPEFRFFIKNQVEKFREENRAHSGLEKHIETLNMSIFHPDVEYQIKRMAKALAGADFILFMGMGASGSLAQYASRKLANLGYFSISFDELTYPIQSFFRKGQKSIVVFMSVSGETKELIEVVSGLDSQKEIGKYCITQDRNSTLATRCDYAIEYAVKEERKQIFLDLTSQLPAMAIVETVIGYLEDYQNPPVA